jgi:hypothetical protein
MLPTCKCGNCGIIASDENHVCKPGPMMDKVEFCGSAPDPDSGMCETMARHLSYKCSACGRPAVSPDLICKPVSIR